jgi:peptidoglycan/LPS O-acetylase OafA/YrhL
VIQSVDDRLLASGDEAGTAPGDRKFRPDVQGLRAVAILLVVLFHAGVPGITGGYVGVDVFFVISGFVITGVLLREKASTGRTSILAFYARRARRIIPAATLVIVVTVLAAYALLGAVSGGETAVDGQWASVFLANIHFANTATNYLASQHPPSPLQNFWSLAVEEQFYLVYPALFLVISAVFKRPSLRVRLVLVLGFIIFGSYSLSIILTATNASSAFFSPFTRAWELALGGFVAVSTVWLRRLPSNLAAGSSWFGLGLIVVTAFVFTPSTSYPGSLVALPVAGAALVIAGGATRPTWGVESVLRQRPLQLLGLISYSLYLWHWPILTIAAERQGKTSLPISESLLWVLLAVVLAIGTYLVIENPVRHSGFLVGSQWLSLALGSCLILTGLAVSTAEAPRGNQALATDIAIAAAGSRCPSPSKTLLAQLRSNLTSSATPDQPTPIQLRMVVVGDSTACTLIPGLEAVAPTYGVRVVNGAVIGCGIVSGHIAPVYQAGINLEQFTGDCPTKSHAAESSALKSGKPNVIVWSSTFEKDSVVTNTPTGSKILSQGSRSWNAVMAERMNQRLRQFLATGAAVVLVGQPPDVDPNGTVGLTASDLSYARLNALLQKLAAKYPGHVGLVNLSSRVCPGGPPCKYVVSGIPLRPDNEHYGPSGSLWVARWLVPQILSAAHLTP